MDENNVTTEIELPDVQAMDYDMVDPGLSTGTKIGIGVAVGTALGLGASWVWKKIRRKDEVDGEEKPRRGFIRLKKKQQDDFEDVEDFEEDDQD